MLFSYTCYHEFDSTITILVHRVVDVRYILSLTIPVALLILGNESAATRGSRPGFVLKSCNRIFIWTDHVLFDPCVVMNITRFMTVHVPNLQVFQQDSIMTTIILAFVLLFLASSVSSLYRNAEAFRAYISSRAPPASTVSTNAKPKPSSLDNSLRGSIQWWEDLAPPFHDASEDYVDLDAEVTHFLFLLHGHRGFSKDLSYLQSVMQQVATTETRKSLRGANCMMESDEETKPINESSNPRSTTDKVRRSNGRQEMVVHSATCNERKTTDGVEKGGERLVEEMLTTIREQMKLRQDDRPIKDITISVLGNSLGGIYGRYAIAKLTQHCDEKVDGSWLLDNRYRIYFNIFCTTATPHLGIAGHTFLPIPRTAEIGVAHAMGDTGRDLFRLNDLMKKMATDPSFLGPLKRFRKRIAYANAYGTDFPVPAQTAAFLSDTSSYPHHFAEATRDDDPIVVDDNGLVVATLHTPPRQLRGDLAEIKMLDMDQNDADDLARMSMSLDALGWKKVFVDVRKEIPNISVPKVSLPTWRNNSAAAGSNEPNGRSSEESCTSDDAPINEDTEEEMRVEQALQRLKQRGVVSSRDVAAAVTAPLFDEKVYWPSGHNMIVAFSRSRLSTYMNKAGRPVVDSLAKELVEDIFSWNALSTEASPSIQSFESTPEPKT